MIRENATIKILKPGVIPKEKRTIYKKTCKNCGCEFEFDFYSILIQCPTCCSTCIVSEADADREEEVDE